MVAVIAVVLVVAFLGLLIWWAAQAPSQGPGDEAARKSYGRGGGFSGGL